VNRNLDPTRSSRGRLVTGKDTADAAFPIPAAETSRGLIAVGKSIEDLLEGEWVILLGPEAIRMGQRRRVGEEALRVRGGIP
jgi:hypothetical protein